MPGLAQKLFHDREGISISKVSKWPLLDRMLEMGALDYVDYSLTKILLKGIVDPSQELAALLCHLSIAARMGHLCIQVTENQILPDPVQLWSQEADQDPNITNASQEDYEEIENLIRRSVDCIPSSLIDDPAGEAFPVRPLCRKGNLIYLQRNWIAESTLLDSFRKILDQTPVISLDVHTIQKKLEETSLNEEQMQGVLKSCEVCFSVICGGPGTGKTHTAGQLIRMIWESMSGEIEIALAAPTGKAAANLEKSLLRALPDLPLKAKTLHALLGVRSQNRWQRPSEKLSADVILVDESSMIDVNMMSRLFASIKTGARLILLGDPHQLPPVEAGSLFADIVHYLKKEKDERVIELQECLRTELRSIVKFAEIVKKGDVAEGHQYLASAPLGIEFHPLAKSQNPSRSIQMLLDHAVNHFPFKNEDPELLFEKFNQFRMLSPLRKGAFGVDALNERFYRHLIKKAKGETFVAPIMLVNNDYRLNLFNGEVGILIRKGSSEKSHLFSDEDVALFPGGEDGSFRQFSALVLPKFEYAYCLSVHKSQGSEFDHILMILPEGSENFGREVLYTGITRARKKLELWTDESILAATIQRQSHRQSGFSV